MVLCAVLLALAAGIGGIIHLRTKALEAAEKMQWRGRVMDHLDKLRTQVRGLQLRSAGAERQLKRLEGLNVNDVVISPTTGQFTLAGLEATALVSALKANQDEAKRIHREGLKVTTDAGFEGDPACDGALKDLAFAGEAMPMHSLDSGASDPELAAVMARCGLSEASMRDRGLELLVRAYLAQVRLFDNSGLPRTDPGRIDQEARTIQEIHSYKASRGL